MKQFLKNTLLFSVILLLITGCLVAWSVYLMNRKDNFKLKPATENVFFGYSHVQYTINDTMIPKSRNLGDAGEAYLYTYTKAAKIIPANPAIKQAFIEFSNRHVNAYMDTIMWGNYYMKPRIPKFIACMNMDEIRLLFKHNPSGLLDGLSAYPRQSLVALARHNNDVMYKMEWGGYKPLNKQLSPEQLATVQKQGTENDALDQSISPDNINYLHKLINLCQAHNIRVWLFRAPAHPLSGYRNNEATFRKVLQREFPDLPFLDFIDFSFPVEEYYDLGHINSRGAYRFSRFLAEVLPGITKTPGGLQPSQWQEIWRKNYEAK